MGEGSPAPYRSEYWRSLCRCRLTCEAFLTPSSIETFVRTNVIASFCTRLSSRNSTSAQAPTHSSDASRKALLPAASLVYSPKSTGSVFTCGASDSLDGTLQYFARPVRSTRCSSGREDLGSAGTVLSLFRVLCIRPFIQLTALALEFTQATFSDFATVSDHLVQVITASKLLQ